MTEVFYVLIRNIFVFIIVFLIGFLINKKNNKL